MSRFGQGLLCAAFALTLAACGQSQSDGDGAALVAADSPPLEAEEIGRSESLAGLFEDDWFFAQDLNFNTINLGKIMVIDAGDETLNMRGQIDAAQMATFQQSPSRKELYVAETYYSRGSRGTRTDVVTIYDRETLNRVGEVILPNNNRAQNVIQPAGFQLTDDEKFALVYTFTPASGMAVIDLDSRKLVNEIDTGGCILAYPAGPRGFAALCGDGKMARFDLDAGGKVTNRQETAAFNDIDNNSMFTMSARVGDTTYFPTYEGYLQPVDLSGGKVVPGKIWHFAEGTDRKPSGWQVISADDQGHLYVIMRAGAKPGDHKFGGGEVWVLDPAARKILRKIELPEDGIAVEASHGNKPVMMVTGGSMELHVFDLSNDKHVRTIGGFLSSQPFAIQAARVGK